MSGQDRVGPGEHVLARAEPLARAGKLLSSGEARIPRVLAHHADRAGADAGPERGHAGQHGEPAGNDSGRRPPRNEPLAGQSEPEQGRHFEEQDHCVGTKSRVFCGSFAIMSVGGDAYGAPRPPSI